jgi:hypothetical protein
LLKRTLYKVDAPREEGLLDSTVLTTCGIPLISTIIPRFNSPAFGMFFPYYLTELFNGYLLMVSKIRRYEK